MSVKVLFIFAVLIGWCALSRSQTPAVDCVPIQGQGWQGCAPAGNNRSTQQTMPAPERWADRWGAVAGGLPGAPPAFGASANMPNERAAKDAALADCQSSSGTKCQIALVYHNQCVAVVNGEKTWSANGSAYENDAIQIGMKRCRADGNSKCNIYYSACSYPVRIQ